MNKTHLRSSRAVARLGLLACAALVGSILPTACADSDPPNAPQIEDVTPTPPVFTPFVAANSVPEDDPRTRGQAYFLEETWGSELSNDWPHASFMLQLMEDEPEVFGNQYASFGFVADPSNPFPVGFRRGSVDEDLVHETCALCHVAELPDGRIWLGAPNTQLDFGRFRSEVNDRWVRAGHPPLIDDLMDTKLRQLGPGRARAETRDYPQVVPAAFPVYYNLGERTHLNYMGTGRNLRTEISFSLFTFGAGNPNDEEALVPFPDRDTVDAFAEFLGTLAPPSAPARPDAATVERGRAVFEATQCNACHDVGNVSNDFVVTLDRSSVGPELLPGENDDFPRGTIRTSALHRVLQDGDDGEGPGADRGFETLLQFIVRNRLSVRQTDGYRVNDLRGLWQSAPYLHNGSVPTLHDLLRPANERPVTFEVSGGFVVDTREPGNDNSGHEFGSDLSPSERDDLVEYLLSL